MAVDDNEEEEEEEEEEVRVTKHSYGALDTSEAGDECWLIRIPPKLSELWDAAPEGTHLGDLVFTKGGSKQQQSQGKAGVTNVKPSFTVHVAEDLAERHHETQQATSAAVAGDRKGTKPSALPLNYSLQAMTKKVPVMHPFVRNPNNGSVKLLGQVSRTANLQVEQDNNYRAMLKDRLVATSVTSARYVKPVETTESVVSKQKSTSSSTNGTKTFGDAVYQVGKRMLDATQESHLTASGAGGGGGGGLQQQQGGGAKKKARKFSNDQPIKSIVFELFAQQQYWTVKDLKAAAVAGGAESAGTKKAETEMRDVLREIGEYHRSGDHKNMWELRKEFQQQN